MKQTKTRLELFSFYDHAGIAKHLQEQARAGWLLERIGSWGWRYRRIEPQELTFSVTYFPKASAYDPGPSEQEQTLREFCRQAGWTLAASSAQLQIFYTQDPNPVPLETDAVVQVENIHAAARRSTLLSKGILGVLAIVQLAMWLARLLSDPAEVLSNWGDLFSGLCWINVLVLCAVELISYFRWYRKALRAAGEQGILLATGSHRGFQAASLTVVIVSLVLYVATMQSRRMMIITAISFGYLFVLITLVNGCRLLLKKLGVSTGVNRTVTIVVDVVLAFGMMGLITWGVMKMDIPDRQPVDTYEYYGMTREVYADELPFAVEDLLDVDLAGYSKELRTQRTFLAAVDDAAQESRGDWAERQPSLRCEITSGSLPALTQWFWSSRMKKIQDRLIDVDPGPWGAEEAYRRDGGNTWLIRWEDRFAELTVDWELTQAQMKVIGEKVLNYAE